MRTGSSPSTRALSWVAAVVAWTLVSLGSGAAVNAYADETPTPSPSAEPSVKATAEPADEATSKADEPAVEESAARTKTAAAEAGSGKGTATSKAAVTSKEVTSKSASAQSTAQAAARAKKTAAATAAAPRAAAVRDASAAREGIRYDLNATTSYWVPDTWQAGADLVISGVGWQNAAGSAGSVIAVKLDEGGVSTTVPVLHPVTGVEQPNKTIYALVQADAAGEWTLRVPYPTAAISTATWATGETHSLRLLSGSLLSGDVIRTAAAGFTVTDAAPEPTASPSPSSTGSPTTPAPTGSPTTPAPSGSPTTPAPSGSPTTPAPTGSPTTPAPSGSPTTPAPSASPTACVPTASTPSVTVAPAAELGGTLHVTGAGWCHPSDGGSRIAVKLDEGAYSRLDSTLHANRTIWAIVDASPADGTFAVDLPLPDGTSTAPSGSSPVFTAGPHTLRLLTGSIKAGDTSRTLLSAPFTVASVAPSPSPTPTPTPTATTPTVCTPTSSTPSVMIATPTTSLGGVVRVTGAGWCHPTDGGSRIAFKLDEGAYSRLDSTLHANRTIWAIVDAKATDGTFDVELAVPNGTALGATGSTPALPTGAHTLRLLTGSLKAGDAARTLLSSEFVVGSYRPTGVPDPVEATEDLTAATRQGVTLARTSSGLTVTVPGAKAGDWIYLNVYSGGSPREPWGATWFQADVNGRVVAPLSGIALPEGSSKVSAQSGNPGRSGALLGWAPLSIAAKPAPSTPSATTTTIIRTLVSTVTTTTTTSGTSSAPTTVPKAPVERASQLSGISNGGATATQDHLAGADRHSGRPGSVQRVPVLGGRLGRGSRPSGAGGHRGADRPRRGAGLLPCARAECASPG